MRCLLVARLYAAVAPAGQAQTFYKCLNAQGLPEFSDTPCAARTRQELDRARSSQQQQQPPSPGRTPSDLQAERIDPLACQSVRRDFEMAANATRPNMATVGARRSAMYGACGMTAPPQVTHHPAALHVFRRP